MKDVIDTSTTAQPVEIIDDDGQVDRESVTLSRSKGETVVWKNPRKGAFLIQFIGESPFAESRIRVAPNDTGKSGEIRKDAPEGTYTYDVKGANSTFDPKIIIQN